VKQGWGSIKPEGASITMIDPGGTVSTKWADNLGASVFDTRTIWTVYAGPQIRALDPDEIRNRSGM